MSNAGKLVKGLLKTKKESVMGKLGDAPFEDPMEPWSVKYNSPVKNEEVIAESRMPATVIKIKQRNAAMSDKDFAQAHKDKSEDELRAMAWRHGYGKDSSHYVDRRKKGQQGVSEEVEKTIYKVGDRVRHELQVIRENKLAGYFLIVYDILIFSLGPQLQLPDLQLFFSNKIIFSSSSSGNKNLLFFK